MKSKKIIASSILSIAACSTLGATHASADSTVDTEGKVAFTQVTENPTNPQLPGTDPTNPEGPGEGTGNGDTNVNNLLRLDYVSNLDFGSHPAPATTTIYDAKAVVTSAGNYVAPWLQVSDLRYQSSTPATGWTLKVAWNDVPTSTTDATKKLTGAKLKLNSTAIGTATASAVVVSTDGQPVLTAATDQGKNVTYGTFGTVTDGTFTTLADAESTTSNATLEVVGGTADAGETYKSTLTWTLSAQP